MAGRLGTSQEWATVDRTAVDELLTVALLSPLLGTNIRAPVRSELVCTDARGGVFTGVGAVRAEVRPEVAREFYRHRTRRGGYVRAETPQEVRARERVDWSEKLLELRPDLVDDDDHSDDDADDALSDPRWFGEVFSNTAARASPSTAASCVLFARLYAGFCAAVISECVKSLVSTRRWSRELSRRVVRLLVSSIFSCAA